VELILFGPHFSDVDMEEADGIAFEVLLRMSIAFDVGQSADTMALEATVQQ
jgi:hypothetical protein